jgi:hypothetical protein
MYGQARESDADNTFFIRVHTLFSLLSG